MGVGLPAAVGMVVSLPCLLCAFLVRNEMMLTFGVTRRSRLRRRRRGVWWRRRRMRWWLVLILRQPLHNWLVLCLSTLSYIGTDGL